MPKEVIKNENNIPQDSWFNRQTKKSWKEVLEWMELFDEVEKLASNLELQEDNDLNIPGLIWYYVLLDWKKVAYFSYRKVNGNFELINFANSHAKNNIREIEKESQLLSEKLETLDNINKIPFLWISTLLKFLNFIQPKIKNTNFLFFTPSFFSIRKDFYKKALNLFQEQWFLKWEKIWRDYKVVLLN